MSVEISSEQEREFADQRAAMVREQIERRGIQDERVLRAMRSVPRHQFVPPDQRYWSYSDGALRLELGQTISQPYIVALMSEMLALQGAERVLEIGTGSGYQAAVLAELCTEVHTIERHQPLAEAAHKKLAELGYTHVQVHVGDGSQGLAAHAPYQAILVTAAAPNVPQTLLAQLVDGGRLVLPVGGKYSQVLECWTRQAGRYHKQTHSAVTFVPLLGEAGWSEKDWNGFRFS